MRPATAPSLITSDPQEARQFAAAQDTGAVYKTIMQKVISEAGAVKLRYTTRVDVTAINDRISLAPHLLRNVAPKAFDARVAVTAVGMCLGAARRPVGVAPGGDRAAHHRSDCRLAGREVTTTERAGPPPWRPYAERLARELTAAGALTDPALRRALVNAPRHAFLPEFYAGGPQAGRRTGGSCTEESHGYLDLVYSDDTLVTQYIERHDWLWATSSSTRPSLMLRMLHELHLAEGLTVLEVGTGTGYTRRCCASGSGIAT